WGVIRTNHNHSPGGLVDKHLGSRARGPEFETRRGDGNLTKVYPLEKSGDRTSSAPTICDGLLFGSLSKNKFKKKKQGETNFLFLKWFRHSFAKYFQSSSKQTIVLFWMYILNLKVFADN